MSLRAGLARCVGAVLVCLGAAGCSPVDLLDATIPTQGLRITKNLPYAPGARHALDLYRADASHGTLPVVVFFYGGAWKSGNKDDYLFVAAALARRGLLVAVPDYRLAPAFTYPAFMEDAAQAVAYVIREAPSWGGDPHRLFVVGHSAGAYIALMLALDPHFLADAGASRNDLAGAVGIAGPYDFFPITDPDALMAFGAHATDPSTQPVNHVDGHAPPVLLLQGDDDKTVMPRNATALGDRIRAAGGTVTVRLYPDTGHVGIIAAFAPILRGDATVVDDVANFVLTTPPSHQ